MSDWRDTMREGLMQSYKPRAEDGAYCSICGSKDGLFSFNAIEYYQDDKNPLPEDFFPMSKTSYGDFGTIRGSFPVCIKCAPTCLMCGLPRYSDKLIKLMRRLEKQFEDSVHWGCGMCDHFHFSDFIKRLRGDENQMYLAQMKRERNESQKKIFPMFDDMFGKK